MLTFLRGGAIKRFLSVLLVFIIGLIIISIFGLVRKTAHKENKGYVLAAET